MGSEQASGTKDEIYNLVSVIYHALKGAEVLEQYARDAREADDQELSLFFNQILEEDRERAQRAKALLKERLGTLGTGVRWQDEAVDRTSNDSFPASDAPASY